MAQLRAKKGDIVKVHYNCLLKDGSLIDTSRKGAPLTVKLGSGEVIPGFEEAIVGMKKGETKTVTIPKEKAYGIYRTDQIFEIDKNQIPKESMPKVGMKLQLKAPNGSISNVLVKDIDDDKITLDANHPLAGEDLTFEIELLDFVFEN